MLRQLGGRYASSERVPVIDICGKIGLQGERSFFIGGSAP